MIGSPELTRAMKAALRALRKVQEIAENDPNAMPHIQVSCDGNEAATISLGASSIAISGWIEGTEYIE